jgi:hypothetical protein
VVEGCNFCATLRDDGGQAKPYVVRSLKAKAAPNQPKLEMSAHRKEFLRQCRTRYIKHLAESAKFEDSTFNKLSSGLLVKRFECQTFHIPTVWQP